jgi:hypothetical protein
MRANMKFRICLRVETMEDSRELLRRSDAAFLPPNIPGRAYIQVGNENVELMQVAWASAPYSGPQVDTTPPVIWLNRRKAEKGRQSGPLQEAPATSDVLVELMYRHSQDNEDVVKQKKPWPDPLPPYLPLDAEYIPGDAERNPLLPLNSAVGEWMRGEGGWKGVDWHEEAMRASVGLIDNPIRAEQLLLRVDLTRGHLVVFGASGWGKTTFLRTLITSLAATHSPAELNMYFFDFGGRGLDVLEALPHRGASIQPSEEERIQRLLRRLEGTLEERKALFSQARADSLLTYNANHPENIQPAILFVIDNFAEFKENYENLMDKMISIAREGRAYGVHLVATGEHLARCPAGCSASSGASRQAGDKADIPMWSGESPVCGDTEGTVSWLNATLELQPPPVSVSDGRIEGMDENTKLAMLAAIDEQPGRQTPEPVEILHSIIPPQLRRNRRGNGRVKTILGFEDIEPAVDLQQRGTFRRHWPPLWKNYRAAFMGAPMATPPTGTCRDGLIISAAFLRYAGRQSLENLPHVLEAISEKEQFTEMVKKIRYEYENRPANKPGPEIFVIADNYDDFGNVVGSATRAPEYGELAELARKYGPAGLHFIMCGQLSILRTMDDFMKQVNSPRYGLGLDATDSPGALGGRVRGGGDEFPPGRGYIVKAGRLSLIQTALPHDEANMEGSLDEWTQQIIDYYPNRARWYMDINPPQAAEPESESGGESEAATGPRPKYKRM